MGFWFGVPDEISDRVEPYDTFVLERSTVGSANGQDGPNGFEGDLFAGLRGLTGGDEQSTAGTAPATGPLRMSLSR